MKIADSDVSVAEAVKLVQAYAEVHSKTLEIFDGLGVGRRPDASPDEVTLADIGKLVVINARLDADDVPRLLEASAKQEFGRVPVDAQLADCEPQSRLWNDAAALYDVFRIDNIGRAKRSKLLHLKRPGFFVISDSVTGSLYESCAAKEAADATYTTTGYWEAARRDIRQPEFGELMSALAAESPTLGLLSRVRVLDLVCWSQQ